MKNITITDVLPSKIRNLKLAVPNYKEWSQNYTECFYIFILGAFIAKLSEFDILVLTFPRDYLAVLKSLFF